MTAPDQPTIDQTGIIHRRSVYNEDLSDEQMIEDTGGGEAITAPKHQLVGRVAVAICSWLNCRKRSESPEFTWAMLTSHQKVSYQEQAQTAIDACYAVEMMELLRLMRREYGAHLSICGKTLVAVDNLLAKLDGKP